MNKIEFLNYVSNKVGTTCNATTGSELLDYVKKHMDHFYFECGGEDDFQIANEIMDDCQHACIITKEEVFEKAEEFTQPLYCWGDQKHGDTTDHVWLFYFTNSDCDVFSYLEVLKEKSIEWNSSIEYYPGCHVLIEDYNTLSLCEYKFKIDNGAVTHNVKMIIKDDSADLFVESIKQIAYMFFCSSLDLLNEYHLEVEELDINDNHLLRKKYYYEVLTDVDEIIKQLTYRPLSIGNYISNDIVKNEKIIEFFSNFNYVDYLGYKEGLVSNISYVLEKVYGKK